MADSRMRILFNSVGAANAAGDFEKVTKAARGYKTQLDQLSRVRLDNLGSLNKVGQAKTQLDAVSGAAKTARTSLSQLASVNLSNLRSLNKIGQGASTAARGFERLGAVSAGVADTAKGLKQMGAAGAAAAPGIQAAGRAARTSAASFRTLASAAPQIAQAGAALKGLSAELTAGGLSAGTTNLSSLSKASREAATSLNRLAGASKGLVTLGNALRSVAGVLNNPVIQAAFNSFAAAVPVITAISGALRGLGRAGDSLKTVPPNLQALASALHNPFFQSAFTSFALAVPAVNSIAQALSAMSRSGTRLDQFATGLDKVRESLERFGPVASNSQIQDLLKNLAAIRAGGAGGGGGGAGGGLGRGIIPVSRIAGLANIVTKPIELAFAGLRKGASLAVSAVGFVATAARTTASAFISFGRFGINAVEGVAGRVRGLISTLARLATASALGTGGVGLILKKSFDADNTFTAIENTLKIATGSADAAREKIGTLAATVDRLGLSFTALAPGLAQFVIAAKGTALEGAEAERIFYSLARASQALGLSSADQAGVARALNQILSKGTVQAEELRGQIGDRMPGAFNLAARAIGVTTAELGKLLKQGKVTAEDFLPKFANQLDKEFGSAASSVERPAAALERLKNQFFTTFVTIGRSGGTKLVVDALNSVTKALRVLNDDGSIARFTEAVTSRLRGAGEKIIGFSRNVYAALQLVRNGNGAVVSDNLPFGDTAFVALFGRNTRQIVRGYADVINIVRRFGRDVRSQLSTAFSGRGFGQGTGAIQTFSRAMVFLSDRVVPVAISGVKFLGRTFAGTVRYVREFIGAFDGLQFGLGFQLNQIITRLTGVQEGVRGAFGVAPERLAFGISYAAYLVNVALEKIQRVAKNTSLFLKRLGENGGSTRLAKDFRDFIGLFSGAEVKAGPEALADSFTAAYTRISDGIRKTYATVSNFAKGFAGGFKYQQLVRQRTPKGQVTPDIVTADPDKQSGADAGQAVARFGEQITGFLPEAIRLAGGFADALKGAAEWVISILDGFRNLVGDEAFGKIASLVIGLKLLNGVTGGASGRLLGGAVSGILGARVAGAGGGAPPVPGGPVPLSTAAFRVLGAATIAAGTIYGIDKILGQNKTTDDLNAQAAKEYAAGRPRDAGVSLFKGFVLAAGQLVDNLGRKPAEFIANRRIQPITDLLAERGGLKQQIYRAANPEIASLYKPIQDQAKAMQDFKDTRAEEAQAAGYVSQFAGGGKYNITIGSKTSPDLSARDRDGMVSWINDVEREQAGANGNLSAAFGR